MMQPDRGAGLHADARLDDTMRTTHADAVANISARTRVQLHNRLQAALSASRPARTHRPAWGLALAASLALVAVIGLRARAPAPSAPMPVAAERSGDDGDLVASLDETPDLYLWLASRDASGLVSE
ncbi:MAG: hypothetical protein ACJ8GK_08445 [Luteimonas sp.]